MSQLNQENDLQDNKYARFARNLLKAAVSNNRLVLRQVEQDVSTELLNEIGTTDTAIGDVTAEIMITTLGKIPNEMYYLEDTTPGGRTTSQGTEIHGTEFHGASETTEAIAMVTETTKSSNEFAGHSMILLVLLITLLVILLMCCTTACLIARSRRRSNFFGKNDMECEPDCRGINQPLLGIDKISDSTSKTSGCSMKH